MTNPFALTLTHTRVAAACTWGATEATIRAEPIRTTDAAIRYLEAHGYSVVPLARGLYLIDGTSSLGKADLIDRAEKLRDRTMKRHQQRKARAA